MKINIIWKEQLKKWGGDLLKDANYIKLINGELFSSLDFWKYKSIYIDKEDLEKFIRKAKYYGYEVVKKENIVKKI